MQFAKYGILITQRIRTVQIRPGYRLAAIYFPPSHALWDMGGLWWLGRRCRRIRWVSEEAFDSLKAIEKIGKSILVFRDLELNLVRFHHQLYRAISIRC